MIDSENMSSRTLAWLNLYHNEFLSCVADRSLLRWVAAVFVAFVYCYFLIFYDVFLLPFLLVGAFLARAAWSCFFRFSRSCTLRSCWDIWKFMNHRQVVTMAWKTTTTGNPRCLVVLLSSSVDCCMSSSQKVSSRATFENSKHVEDVLERWK